MDIHTFAMQCSIDILPASLNVQFAKMMLHIFNVCLILNISIRHIYSWIEFTMYGSILHKLNILCHNCDWRCLFIYVKKICFMWLNQGLAIRSGHIWRSSSLVEFIVKSKNFCFPLVMTFCVTPVERVTMHCK